MKKTTAAIPAAIITALLITTPTHATDLPIDITAIGRQGQTNPQITTRIGANLFTYDAQRVNEVFAQQIQQRQDTALYLFATIPLNQEIDLHAQLTRNADNMALFAQPVNFNQFNTAQDDEIALPLWLTILIFALCATGGFIWAMVSKSKKKGRA